MKLYDLIRQLLENNESLRSNDKKLIWTVWREQGAVINDLLVFEKFKDLTTTPESITRARRKVQEHHPNLGANAAVKSMRKNIQRQKGTHVYRERAPMYNSDGTVSFK